MGFLNLLLAESWIEKPCLINFMNRRKIACNRIENICFDIDLMAKKNAIL